MAPVPDTPRRGSVSTDTQQQPTTSRSVSQTTSQPATLPLQMTSSSAQTAEMGGIPMRHPRPLSAVELHLELEKEQEAVVNRLTRELAALRAQTASVASVASNASTSTSTSAFDPADTALPSATSIQSTTTRHRSSSNLSARSSRSSTVNLGQAQPGSVPPTGIASTAGTSQASVDRARDAAGVPSTGVTSTNRSRQNSTVVAGRSGQPSPSMPMHQTSAEYFSSQQSISSMSSVPGINSPRSQSRSSSRLSSARYEEAQHARAILDQARAENELLIRRVKELEREIRERGTERSDE